MTDEYWLQKKTVGGWSNITWYDNLEQANKNYLNCLLQIGYSYRLCKVEVIECKMLEEVTELPTPNETMEAKGWANPAQPSSWAKPMAPGATQGWGKPNSLSGEAPIKNWGTPAATATPKGTPYIDGQPVPEHGMIGKVWLVHHGLKQKKRVDPNEVDAMMAQGYERGGPKTAFRS